MLGPGGRAHRLDDCSRVAYAEICVGETTATAGPSCAVLRRPAPRRRLVLLVSEVSGYGVGEEATAEGEDRSPVVVRAAVEQAVADRIAGRLARPRG